MVDMLIYRCVTSENRHRVRQEPSINSDVIGYIEKHQEVEGGEIIKTKTDSWIATCSGWSLMKVKGKQFLELVTANQTKVRTRREKQKQQDQQDHNNKQTTALSFVLQKGIISTEDDVAEVVSYVSSLPSKKIPSSEILNQIYQFYSSRVLRDVQKVVLKKLLPWLSFTQKESTAVILSCISAIVGCVPELIEEHLKVLFDYFCNNSGTPQKEANLFLDHLPSVLIAVAQCECSRTASLTIESVTTSLSKSVPIIIEQLLIASDGNDKLLIKITSEWIVSLEQTQFCAANAILTHLVSQLIAFSQQGKYLSVTAEIIGRAAKAVRLQSQCIPTKVNLSTVERNLPAPRYIPTYDDNCETINNFISNINKQSSIDNWIKHRSSKSELKQLLTIINVEDASLSAEALLSKIQNYESSQKDNEISILKSMDKTDLVDEAAFVGMFFFYIICY